MNGIGSGEATGTIRVISAAETRPLRHLVLRPHQRPEELVYPGDDEPDSFHLGGFEPDGTHVAIASFYRQNGPTEESSGADWRLRGMAVRADRQGTGWGGRMLDAGWRRVLGAGGGRGLWCNARLTASRFYARHGFRAVGDCFDIAGIGPHYVMLRIATEPDSPPPRS